MNPMESKIKVLHVVHWPKSGIVSYLYNFLKTSISPYIEYHIIFFIEDLEPSHNFGQICASVHYLNYATHRINSITKFRRIINRIEPHIIHTHSYQPGIWSRLLTLTKKPIVVSTVHSPYPYFCGYNLKAWFKKLTETITVNLFNARVICDSDAIKKHLIQNTNIQLHKLSVVKVGINIEAKRYDARVLETHKKAIHITDDLVIISVGRLSGEKGYDNLLRAFALLLQHIENCALIIIGQGDLLGPLKDLSAKLDIEGKTHFLGYAEDIFPYLAVSSVYVCSSRYEGLPVSILEAMMMKLPIIATNVGGIPEVIEDDLTGILVEPDRPDQLVQSILKLLMNEKKREKMINEGYCKLVKEFDIKIAVKKIESMYLNLLQRSGRN